MSRRISSFTVGLGALLIAGGVSAAPASGPVEKGLGIASSERNAKPKPKAKKGADADEASEEAEDTDKKSKGKKGKKGKAKKDADEADADEEEKPKKKGKKAKKEEPPPEEEEEKPKKKGKKGKKEKKEEPPPEEEPVDVKDTESPTATPEGDPDELPPEEEPLAEPPPSDEEPKEEEKAEASVSTADAAGKLYLGLRLGYGIFMGKTTGDAQPVEFSGKIPIWIDLGYRFSPAFLLALYGQYAFASIECPSGFDCSATVMRFGLQAQYGFAPEAKFAPWAGLGIGYEIASMTLTDSEGGEEGSIDLKGVEFANLQFGADFMVSKAVGIGPFLSFSLGRYSSGNFETTGTTVSGGVSKKEFHEWLVLGVRGAFSL